MSELRIPRSEMISAVIDGRGNLTIELTEEGERSLVEEARNRTRRLEALAAKRRAALAAMGQEEFVALVLSRFGGPTQLERDEIARRVRLIAETLRPAFDAVRGAGLIPAPGAPAA